MYNNISYLKQMNIFQVHLQNNKNHIFFIQLEK